MQPEIKLTFQELFLAASHGVMQQVKAIKKHSKDKTGCARDWDKELVGATCEAAAAKFLGTWWMGNMDGFKGPDVDDRFQIRGTRVPEGRLLVRTDDSDDDIFTMVVVEYPGDRFRFPGWMLGEDCKRDEWWGSPDPGRPKCWAVPQEALRAMGTGALSRG